MVRAWIALWLLLTPGLARAQADGPTLALGGDVLYDAPLAYQLAHRAREVGRVAAYREVFADLSPLLEGADFALVNLEAPVSARYRERSEAEDVPVFRAPHDFLTALRAAGVDAVTLANNHAYDQGLRGLRNTVAASERERLLPIGVGADRAAAARATVVDVDDARVAIAAWTEGTNHRPRRGEGVSPQIAFVRDGNVAASLTNARERADLVIAVFHWVHEDHTRPRASMRAIAREAAEAGADLVVGHGTHVPGSTETVRTSDGREVRVLYSLGNLLAAMEEPAGTLASREIGVRDAPLALVRTRWRGRRLTVEAVEVRPCWIARPVGRAPWLEGGRLAVSRPVDLERELARLSASGCGSICDRRASAYRRRMALMERAMAEVDAPPAPVVLAEADAPRPARVSRGRAAHRVAAAEPASGRSVSAPRRRAPPARRAPRPVIDDDDPRLAPLRRGVDLGVAFAPGAVVERAVDDAAVRRLAALLREDRGLRVEIVGYATAAERAERPTLGALRARRVKGLVAILGPSRRRFTTRGATGAARVVVRVRR